MSNRKVCMVVFLIVVLAGIVYGMYRYDKYLTYTEERRVADVASMISLDSSLDSAIVSMSTTDKEYASTIDDMSIFNPKTASYFKNDSERKRYMVEFLKSFVDMKRIDFQCDAAKAASKAALNKIP